ncbi:hypothetical protein LXT21_20915 [Myxococcus sp. K38C18041901]|uniref:hypothetical protein n=1 Tax=Myxococcus guangdongensis TaxID=2906760 RepID=UPI0020A7BED5|nr:hypothetical protein [Myxococcus guangdongensis]MCP3061245.1 hypothetical protein [Myxococcus guangdongensis]
MHIKKAVEELLAVGNHVKAHPDFEVIFEAFPIMRASDMDDWQEVIREEAPSFGEYVLPASLKEVYGATGALRLHWVSKKSRDLIGVTKIVGIVGLFQTDEESSKGMTIEDCCKQLRPFDVIDERRFVGMRLPQQGDEVDLVYVDKKQRLEVELSLNPVQYIVELSRYKGLVGWQKRFFKGAKAGVEDASAVERMRQLFPFLG